MAAFMKGDRVAITDPVSLFRMRPGWISDIRFTSDNNIFYKVNIDHTGNSVWVNEKQHYSAYKPGKRTLEVLYLPRSTDCCVHYGGGI